MPRTEWYLGHVPIFPCLWSCDPKWPPFSFLHKRNVVISYSTYDSGHMVYLRADMLVKFHDDVAAFIGG